MNYIYDIFLNFNQFLYEVFEWNKDDKIYHVRKIPFIVLSTDDLLNLVNKKVIIDNEFLTKIYCKTEYFSKKNVYSLDYCFLATDRHEIIAFKLDKDGAIEEYSKLLFADEMEVLNYSENISSKIFNYKIISDKKLNSFKTRNEKKIKKYIYNELKLMINDVDKVHFLYLECFGKMKKEKSVNLIYQELENNFEKVYIKVYNFLRTIAIKR